MGESEWVEYIVENVFAGVHLRAGEPIVAPLISLIERGRLGDEVIDAPCAGRPGNVEANVGADSVVGHMEIAEAFTPVVGKWFIFGVIA